MTSSRRKYADLASLQAGRKWTVVVVLAVLVSVVEAVAALLVYTLLGLVTGVERSVRLPVIGDVSGLLGGDRSAVLLAAAVVTGLFFVLRGVLVLAAEYVSSRVTENAGARLSVELADGYVGMPYAFHLRRNSAELIRNAYSTVETLVREVFRPLVKILSEGLIVLGVLTVLLLTAPLATALVLAAMLPAALLLLRFVYPRLRLLGREMQETSRASIQCLQQSFEGLRDIKVLGREPFFSRQFRSVRRRLARSYYLRDVFRDIPSVGLETMIILAVAGLFAAAVIIEGDAVGAIPLLGLFGYAALRLKPSVTAVVKALNSIRFARAGVDDLHSDLIMVRTTATPPNAKDVAPLPFDHEITLESVSFRYESAAVDALRDIDLTISKGESIGIVGPTGGGKTTLMDVILGLLEPTEGRVLIDGVDIRGCPGAWQRHIGIVPQTLFLIDDTLRQNIALGLPDEDIDDEQVTEAVELAQLSPVVDALPDGLETVVGERGIRLSGGQRQRVAIARALYHRPMVLLFDEGTSALDLGTEGQLLRALEQLRSRHTIVTVAHRLATVRDCDRVVLIEAGRLVDSGPYEELLQRNESLVR
jgi:ATP-binding cassette, subfamily B, bacterial PglK